VLFFGWLLLLACGIEIVQVVLVGRWVGFFQHLLAAILFGITGLLIAERPVISAEVATVFMAMFFLIGRLFQLVGSVAVTLRGWDLACGGRNYHIPPALLQPSSR
jgi:uncharacterized membrane protein HdeD (DUF308 family)